MKPVCIKCKKLMRCKRNDYGVCLTTERGPYQIWSGDLWECPGCGVEIISGYGLRPVAENFMQTFTYLLDGYRELDMLCEVKE